MRGWGEADCGGTTRYPATLQANHANLTTNTPCDERISGMLKARSPRERELIGRLGSVEVQMT